MEIRIGLKNLRIAELTKDESAEMSNDGMPHVAYGTINRLANVQKINYKPSVQTQSISADDVSEDITQCTGAEGSMDRTLITPEESALLLNKKVFEDGIAVAGRDDEPREFATGFQCKIKGGKTLYIWLLRTKYSETDFTAETAEEGSIKAQADTISFKSFNRKCDDGWMYNGISDDPEFAKTFFSQATLQRMATGAKTKHMQPANVVFADTMPADGVVGNIYIVANKAYYWDGTEMNEIEPQQYKN